MRKLVLSLILFVGIGTVVAQEPVVTWEDLVKQKGKSDTEITNAKKNIKVKTWLKRADLYYSCYSFNTAGLYQGMPAKGGYNNAELIIGTPQSKETSEDGETWIYPRKKLFFKDGVLQNWEETEFIDKEAAKKSAEALLKANELDIKGSLKNKASFKNSVFLTRGGVINKGIEYYNKDEYKNAFVYMELGAQLGEFPKLPADTAYDGNVINYYLGIIALKAGMKDEAISKFNKSIENNYEPGASYHYIAESYMQSGDSAKYIDVVKKGFEKYPSEEQLLIDLINFYIAKDQSSEVLKYLDMAIAKNPKNPSYYSAKGTVYFNTFDDLFDKYIVYMDSAVEYKKKAFRDRANSKLAAEDLRIKESNFKEGVKVYEEIIDNFDKAEELYNTSLDKDAGFFNSAYNLATLYMRRSKLLDKEADYEIKFTKNFAKSAEISKKSQGAIKIAAEKYEIAHKIDPKDRDVLQILKSIYYRLKDQVNMERVENEISNLGQEVKSDIK